MARTKTRTDPNDDMIAARNELCEAKLAHAQRDDDVNRSRLAFAREMVDLLLDQALEADCT